MAKSANEYLKLKKAWTNLPNGTVGLSNYLDNEVSLNFVKKEMISHHSDSYLNDNNNMYRNGGVEDKKTV
ncbi:unnamed protein product [Heterobilharzia americana]|nr:unnamed protein product [Heterobilharzia americana]